MLFHILALSFATSLIIPSSALVAGQPLLPPAPSAQAPVPPVPQGQGKSPVDIFRELCAMTPQQRAEALASKPQDKRRVIEIRLKEYDALTSQERELAFERMKLRYQLRPLLRANASERVMLLSNIVAQADRRTIEDRLQRWDKLSAEMQQEILENDALLDPILSSHSRPVMLTERQKRIYEQFQKLFGLSETERTEILQTLSAKEREETQYTLQEFQKLPVAQREQSIAAFKKFSSLSPTEKRQFLVNVENWQKMSEAERQMYRHLATVIHPRPPTPPSPTPPIPPVVPTPGSLVTTNH